jgi:type IV fimbrial biogenesis protein FimT
MRFLKRTRGFSLLEIVFVLTLSTLLLCLGLPSFKHFFEQTGDKALLETLIQALQLARREALLARVTVTVCQSNNQNTCSGQWQEGFIVWRDLELTGVPDNLQIVQAFHLPKTRGRLQWRAFPWQRSYLQFLPSGATKQENGSFWYCPSGKSLPVWALQVAQSGTWRVRYPNDKGRIDDARGRLLECE